MKNILLGAFALFITGAAAQAATYNYDFKKEANSSGQIGEAIFDTFNTSTNGIFTGPALEITANKNGGDAFVYFDNGNAGMGVCSSPLNSSQLNAYQSGSGTNRCIQASDDGLTELTEILNFTAASEKTRITAFYINSNHDNPSLLQSTIWEIGGQNYDFNDFTTASLSGSGDIRLDVNFLLDIGDSVSLRGVQSPDSYISGIAVATVPIPAAGLMLLFGLGGLGALRGRGKVS